MKKSAFIITETILTALLAATALSVAYLAKDSTQTDTAFKESLQSSSISKQSSKTSSAVQSSASQQSSKTSTVSKNESSVQSSQESSSSAQKLILKEPAGLSSQPSELTKYITDYKYTYDDMNFDHLIVVDTDKTKATVYCYQKGSDGYWWNIVGNEKAISDNAYIGENGADFVIKEGSKKTPLGFYSLGDGFYIGSKPTTTYPLFQITDDTYWVDDPNSAFYNTKVEGTDKKDWSSAEHMISAESSYKYGIVINYNTDQIKSGAGSAIFLHCGSSPTAGCVAVPENTMKTILEWLDSDSNAFIFITT